MSNVSLERYYFVLYDGALTLKMSKMALNAFCNKTLHILLYSDKRKQLLKMSFLVNVQNVSVMYIDNNAILYLDLNLF